MGFVAAHFGAGYHSFDKEENYRILMNKCCSETAKFLETSDQLIEAIILGIRILEVRFQ